MKAGESPPDQDSFLLSRKYDPEDTNRRGGASKGVSRPQHSWRHDAGRALNFQGASFGAPPPSLPERFGLTTSLNGHPRFSRGKAPAHGPRLRAEICDRRARLSHHIAAEDFS